MRAPITLAGLALLALAPTNVDAQDFVDLAPYPMRGPGAYQAPGYYGTYWGSFGYGSIRVGSAYASPFGAGTGYGYGPFTMPGYGAALYRPGFSVPGYTYGRGYYGTYPAPVNGYVLPVAPPPIGLYAPGYGAPPVVPGPLR